MTGWPRESLIAALQDAADALGPDFSQPEYERRGIGPASSVIIERFGSWNAAKEAAGLPTNPVGSLPDSDLDLPDPERPWTDRERLEALCDQGLTQAEIAAELGTTQPTISNWLRYYGIIESRG